MKTLVLPACSGSHLSPHQSLPLVCPPESELISISDCTRRQSRTGDRGTVRMAAVTVVKLTLTMTVGDVDGDGEVVTLTLTVVTLTLTVVTLTLTLTTTPMLTALVVNLGALIVSDY